MYDNTLDFSFTAISVLRTGPPLFELRVICLLSKSVTPENDSPLVTISSAATFSFCVADCTPNTEVEIAEVMIKAQSSSFKSE